MTRAVALLSLFAAAAAAGGCGRRLTPPKPPPPAFVRQNTAAGVAFHHEDGSSGRHYFAEVMGSGCLFADLTGDGRPDLYLLNGAPLPGAPGDRTYGNRFFRNNGDGTFTDDTARAGLRDGRYCFGCCVGDYDNDGHVDLYVTHLDRNTLFRSNGDGTFTDVTGKARVPDGGFSSAAAFADYDGDGYLDLYVSRYVKWTPAMDLPCSANDGARTVRVYCRPNVYSPLPGILYHNNRDGTFSDVTRAVGMTASAGRGLGCVWCDIDNDGDPDLFVANDMSANLLYVNNGHGHFTEEGLTRGVALGENGRPQAGMGVAAVDYDGDGQFDLACTNFSGEYLALYHNLGGGHFEDASAGARLLEATSPYVGFGLSFADLDLDGWPDLFVGNGHVTEAAERFYPGVSFAQPSLCLLSNGAGAFAPAPNPGPAVTTPRVSRGLAAADYNADGALDVLVNNWRGEPDLLRNELPRRGGWLRLSLRGKNRNPSAIGARVEVTAGGRTAVQEVRSGGSYGSQSELALAFGLGAAAAADTVTVRWPGGAVEMWKSLRGDASYELRQGSGSPAAASGALRNGSPRRPMRRAP